VVVVLTNKVVRARNWEIIIIIGRTIIVVFLFVGVRIFFLFSGTRCAYSSTVERGE
jgi:hypothetical protein